MGDVALVEIVRTQFMEIALRRYNGKRSCDRSGVSFCNASNVEIPRILHGYDDPGARWAGSFIGGRGYPPNDEKRKSPAWPTHCACGYEFVDSDERIVHEEVLYRRADAEEPLFITGNAPIGAIWDAQWWPDKGPDGRVACILLPGRDEWMPDAPATNGGKWDRSGAWPKITCTPSIRTPRYHGFLTNGVLRACDDSPIK